MAVVSPNVMARRINEFRNELSYAGMSAACVAGLRPVRQTIKKPNFGFRDRTGQTRRRVGLVKPYAASTSKRRRGGGAYFRAGGVAGLLLEYRYEGTAFIRPAVEQNIGLMQEFFVRRAIREQDKAVRKAIAKGR